MENVETKVIIGLARFSYVHVWEPAAIGDGVDKKYSVSLIIPKSDTALLAKIKRAIEAAKEAGKAKFGGKIPPMLKLPLRDGDEERPDDEAYKNSYFLNASCKTKPTIVNAMKKEITEEEEFYSGCFGFASVNFYAFNTSGNKGVACGLNHLLKAKDGEFLGGKSTADSDFKDLDIPMDDFLS